MVNRSDLKSDPQFKSWSQAKKGFDAIILPILCVAFLVIVFLEVFWLYNYDFSEVMILLGLLLVGFIGYYAYTLIAPYSIGEFTFEKKKIFPYSVESSPKLRLKDSSGKWYRADACIWCRLPVGVPIVLIHRDGKIYDFMYYDDFYNRFDLASVEPDTRHSEINISLDGVNWEKSTLKNFNDMLGSSSFREKVFEDFKANSADYK